MDTKEQPSRAAFPLQRRSLTLAAAVAALWVVSADAGAQQVYRCVVNGKTVYQQEPCEKSGGRGREVNVEPAVTASSPQGTAKPAEKPAAAAAPAPAPAAPPAAPPARTELEIQADACLDWYRPLLRDPRGAYHRDARIEKGVLTFTIFATNDRGGYEQKTAACEFRSGRLDEAWTKTQSRRHGW